MVDRLPQVVTDNYVTRFCNITNNKPLEALVTLVSAVALVAMFIYAPSSVFLTLLGGGVIKRLVTVGFDLYNLAVETKKNLLNIGRSRVRTLPVNN